MKLSQINYKSFFFFSNEKIKLQLKAKNFRALTIKKIPKETENDGLKAMITSTMCNTIQIIL